MRTVNAICDHTCEWHHKHKHGMSEPAPPPNAHRLLQPQQEESPPEISARQSRALCVCVAEAAAAEPSLEPIARRTSSTNASISASVGSGPCSMAPSTRTASLATPRSSHWPNGCSHTMALLRLAALGH